MVKEHNVLHREEVVEASNFLVQYLTDQGFEGNLDDGTALYDLVIKPMSLLYALFVKKLDATKSYFSLNDALRNKELLGSDYDAAVDSILSNWFIDRKDGSPTAGVLRLVFTKNFDELVIPETSEFYYNKQTYTPRHEHTFNKEHFQHFLDQNQRMYYYVEFPVSCTENLDTEIEEYERFTTNYSNVYLVRVEAAEPFVPGEVMESSENFADRARYAITTRELISEKAIITELRDKITSIKDVYIAGHGAREQLRDVKDFLGISAHVGNKADIYPYSQFQKKTVEFKVVEAGVIDISSLLVNHIFSVQYEDEGQNDVMLDAVYKTSNIDPILAWSEDTGVVLYSDDFVVDRVITITYLTCQDVLNTSNLIFQDNSIVTCFSPIIKSFYPVILHIEAECRISSDVINTQSEDYWKTLISSKICNFVDAVPRKQLFTRSEMVSYVHNNMSELKQILFPVPIQFSVFDLNKAATLFDSEKSVNFFQNQCITEALLPHFVVPSDLPNSVSVNTIKFYTSPEHITLSIR